MRRLWKLRSSSRTLKHSSNVSNIYDIVDVSKSLIRTWIISTLTLEFRYCLAQNHLLNLPSRRFLDVTIIKIRRKYKSWKRDSPANRRQPRPIPGRRIPVNGCEHAASEPLEMHRASLSTLMRVEGVVLRTPWAARPTVGEDALQQPLPECLGGLLVL